MTKEQILQHVNFDLGKTKAIFEWLNSEQQKSVLKCQDALIDIYTYGEKQGVRVQALGEDFVISLHDIDNGKNDFSYDELMSRLNELNLTTFSRKQAAIICIYFDTINKKLIESGGEAFAEDWYASNELHIQTTSNWFIDGTCGCIDVLYDQSTVFRCRPIIDLANNKE